MTFTLGQIADLIHAEGDFATDCEATGYSIDSRTLASGDLFFAIAAERDGHDFVEAAMKNGAVAAVVSNHWLAPDDLDQTRLLWVPESEDCVLKALQTLGRAARRRWAGDDKARRVVAITGSAGKTTTKEAVANVLAAKFDVFRTAGNLNNHFGVPLQLLRLEPRHELAVIEMGMNHAGEIAALCRIAEPDWGVVSNVGQAHIEFFPDGVDGIARAKQELIDSLPPGGLAILNADDPRVAAMATGHHAILYGTSPAADVQAIEIEDHGLFGTSFRLRVHGKDEPQSITLHLPGRHNVLNALAAVAVGLSSGLTAGDCLDQLASIGPTSGRGNLHTWYGAHIINDTYNSNPDALRAMMTALRSTPARRRILIAGEMLELGEQAAELHAQCGRLAADFDVVIGVRGHAAALVDAARAGTGEVHFFETPEAAGDWMHDNLRAGDVVLLKASRGVRLERALDRAWTPEAASARD